MKIIIKFFFIALVLNLAMQAMPVYASGNAIMCLTSAKTDYYVGDTVYVQIQVETNGENINTVRSIMNFSGSEVLLVNDFIIGSAWPNVSPGKELNNATDYINVGGFILVESVNKNSLFGTLIFKANTIGSSVISFAEGSHLISPEQEEKINLAGCQPITINVIGEPPPPPPQNHPPVFQPIGNKQIDLGEQLNFNVSATDPDNDLVRLGWNIPDGATFTNVVNDATTVSGNFSWTPLSEGIYTITFSATDNNVEAKSATLTIVVGVNIPPPPLNHAPVFQPIGEKTVNAGDTITFNIIATDPDGDNVILTFTPLDSASLTPITSGITSTSKFSWTPQNFGIYYVVFTATDDAAGNPLSSTQSIRITVFGGQCPPCGGGGGSCPVCECKEQTFGDILILDAPTIYSPSHPNQDLWYANNSPEFIWDVDGEAVGFSFNLDQVPVSDPATGYYFSKDKMFNFGNISDGIWFFHVKAQYADGWGPTAHYQIKIDTTPPEFFKPIIEDQYINGVVIQQIIFSALDKFSGLAYYELKVDNGSWRKAVSPYTLSDLEKSGKIMALRAVDNAGNAVEAHIDLTSLKVLPESKSYNLVSPTLPPPVIEHIILPYKIGSVVIRDFIIITGTSLPDSLVSLYIKEIPDLIIQTATDADGHWKINIEKELSVGSYTLFAIATIDNINTLPSESVGLNLLEKYSPAKSVRQNFYWWLLLIPILLIILSVWLLHYINYKIYEKKRDQNNGAQDHKNNH